MGVQVTVRLPDKLGKALELAKRRTRRRASDIICRALSEYLCVDVQRGRRPADRVRGLLGSLASGIGDLAERHREHVLVSLKRGR